MSTLRQKQINALKQMLNLNQPQTKLSASEPKWKVLVYDNIGQDIISVLIPVKELRELGVTLFVHLHSDRDPIPEVPAVYFCAPTDENLGRISQDFQNCIYDIYHLNFISPISRQKLEDVASAALQANCVANIHKVYDQYLNFISLEDNMFILKNQNSDSLSYYAINKADTKDTEMEEIMNTVVDCLFSVFVTLGIVPIIRSPKGNAAEMVARKLDKKLRENLADARNNLLHSDSQGGNFNFQRPLLIILDRNVDMATPLHHTWTYQALAHDLLNLNLNRVVIEENKVSGGVRAKNRPCELDMNDKFWMSHKGSPFPTVAEAIQEELEQYKTSEEEVKKLKSSMGIDGDDDRALSFVSDNTAKITSAVNSLPQLLEKKRLIDMHTTIATSVLNGIKSRKLDNYFELEEKIMSKTQALDKALYDIITDPETGTADDKMRLFLIYFICAPNLNDSDLKRFESALAENGCDLNPIHYIKRWKRCEDSVVYFLQVGSAESVTIVAICISLSNFKVVTSQFRRYQHEKNYNATLNDLMQATEFGIDRNYTRMVSGPNQYEGAGTKTVSMFSKLVSHGSNFVMEGVKNLVIKRHNLPVTRIVDHLMEMKNSPEMDEYHYLDPKQLKQAEIPRNRSPFQDAIVFIVGGGNYIEYQNLIDYAKQKTSAGSVKRITYGSSTLINATQFLKQLSLLGQEIA